MNRNFMGEITSDRMWLRAMNNMETQNITSDYERK